MTTQTTTAFMNDRGDYLRFRSDDGDKIELYYNKEGEIKVYVNNLAYTVSDPAVKPLVVEFAETLAHSA